MLEWMNLSPLSKLMYTLWMIFALVAFIVVVSVVVTVVTSAFYNAKLSALKKYGGSNKERTTDEKA